MTVRKPLVGLFPRSSAFLRQSALGIHPRPARAVLRARAPAFRIVGSKSPAAMAFRAPDPLEGSLPQHTYRAMGVKIVIELTLTSASATGQAGKASVHPPIRASSRGRNHGCTGRTCWEKILAGNHRCSTGMPAAPPQGEQQCFLRTTNLPLRVFPRRNCTKTERIC